MPSLYLFYRKNTKSLYAYTTSKKEKKRFVSERGNDQFIYQKKYIDDNEYEEFKRNNPKECLVEIVLGNSDETFKLMGTYGEDYRMDEKSDIIEHEMNQAYNNLVRTTDFGDEITEAITYLTSGKEIKYGYDTYRNKRIELGESLDTLTVFLDIFKETFSK